MNTNMQKEVRTNWTHMDLATFYALSEVRSDESDAGFPSETRNASCGVHVFRF